jgi:hypothetical protein
MENADNHQFRGGSFWWRSATRVARVTGAVQVAIHVCTDYIPCIHTCIYYRQSTCWEAGLCLLLGDDKPRLPADDSVRRFVAGCCELPI